jgi:Tfp pilus assembly protein PilX
MLAFKYPSLLSRPVRRASGHQTGAALFIVVVVSLIVTLMGVQLVNRLVFGQRSALFETDLVLARENAEAALRDGERDVMCLQWVVTASGSGLGTGDFQFVPNSARTLANTRRSHCDIQATNATQNGSLGGTLGACTSGYITVLLDDVSTFPSPTTLNGCSNTIGSITRAPVVDFGTYATASAIWIPDSQPFYTVEVLLMPNGQVGQSIPYYRIRGTGFGRNKFTRVTIESIFRPL